VVCIVVSGFAKSDFADTFLVWDLSELGKQGAVYRVSGAGVNVY
jgi:hypothetical protein